MNIGIFDMFQTLAEILKETELAPSFFLQVHDQLTQLSKEFDHSVQFSCSVVSDSLWPHGLQRARPPLSITNSQSLLRLLSFESVMPSNCLILCRPLLLPPSIFPSIRAFQMSQFFASGGQNIGALASASLLPMNIQDGFPLGLTSLISLQSKGLARVFSNTTVQKHQFFSAQPYFWPNSHILRWLLEKP